MTSKNQPPLNSHLVYLEELVTKYAKKLKQANEDLQQFKADLEQSTNTNDQLSDDIHQYRLLEEQLKNNETTLRLYQERLHSILGSIEDVVWSIVPDTGQILYLNTATETVYGRPISAFLNNLNLWEEIIYPEDKERVKKSQKLLYEIGKQDIEYRIFWPDKQIYWIRVRSRLIRDDKGNPLRIDGLTTEITESKNIREQLRHDALHDSLTGLPNQTLLRDRIKQAIKRYQRTPNKYFSVLFLDLDEFKVINDSLGHVIGDQVLITISQRLAKCLRSEDTLCRLGGDEFVILLENLAEVKDAINIAERIHEILKTPIFLLDKEIFVSMSIGIVLAEEKTFYDNHYRVNEILRDADTAMYEAKAKGKGKSAVFNPSMYHYAVKRLQVANDLQRAIERQELIVYYQPIISLSNNYIHGFEALVRWQHPEKGLIPPADFIPIAEETDLILQIDEWVLRQACAQLCLWQQQFPRLVPLTISVNLSSKHLAKSGLIEILDDVLQKTSLEAKSLKLEITESFVLEQTKIARDIFQQVAQRKIQLCLDDFGTGYSSLSYLDCFPFDVLKIDRSFIKRLGKKSDKCEIIQAIVNLGLTLGMSVVAEGVENKLQLNKLKNLNCDYGQGYGFFPPLDRDKITALLDGANASKIM